jgi:BASS family bile acid:Na+ symporter
MTQVVEALFPLALAFVMFSLGLELTGADFKRVFAKPKAFIAGVIGQMVLLPAVAFLIASAFPLPPEIAVGVMIIAAVPGGLTSNFLTRFAGGDTALSISLTALTSLASMVTVPLIVFFSLGHFGGVETTNLSVTSTALAMFAMVAVPVASGILVRARATRFAQSVQVPARKAAGVIIVLVVAAAFAGASDDLAHYLAQAGLVTAALNISMMALAFAGAMLVGLARPQRIALSIECGLQNVTMAAALVMLLGLPSAYAIPAAAYTMTMLVTAILFTGFSARKRASGALARAEKLS